MSDWFGLPRSCTTSLVERIRIGKHVHLSAARVREKMEVGVDSRNASRVDCLVLIALPTPNLVDPSRHVVGVTINLRRLASSTRCLDELKHPTADYPDAA